MDKYENMIGFSEKEVNGFVRKLCKLEKEVWNLNKDFDFMIKKSFERELAKDDPETYGENSHYIISEGRKNIINLKEIIEKLKVNNDDVPIKDIIEKAKDVNMNEEDVEKALEKLKRSGNIFEPRRGIIVVI